MKDPSTPELSITQTADAPNGDEGRLRRLADSRREPVRWDGSFRPGDLMSRLARELRTPLAATRECIVLAGDSGDPSAGQRRNQYQRLAMDRLDEITNIIDVMHDLALVQAGNGFHLEFERSDVYSIAVGASRVLEKKAEARDITIQWDIPVDLPEILVEPRGIRQILMCLADNAVKFTEPGGVVRIAADSVSDDEMVRVQVEDSGPGVHPDEVDYIFGPFTQGRAGLTANQRGVGLGLTISRAIAHRNGGDIGLSERPDGGTIFWFTVPRMTVDAVQRLVIEPGADHFANDPNQGLSVVSVQLRPDAATTLGPGWPQIIKGQLRRSDRVLALDDDFAVVAAPACSRSARAVVRRIEETLGARIQPDQFWTEMITYPTPGLSRDEFIARVRRSMERGSADELAA